MDYKPLYEICLITHPHRFSTLFVRDAMMRGGQLTGQVRDRPEGRKQRHELEDIVRIKQRLKLAEWRE